MSIRHHAIRTMILTVSLWAMVAGVLAVFTHPGAQAATTSAPNGAKVHRCATIITAFRTPSGHEADSPDTYCGLGLHGIYFCTVTSGHFGAPLARLDCRKTSR